MHYCLQRRSLELEGQTRTPPSPGHCILRAQEQHHTQKAREHKKLLEVRRLTGLLLPEVRTQLDQGQHADHQSVQPVPTVLHPKQG